MSTILDALKKSEQERKLNKLPTLTDMPAPQEPSKWPLFIAIVLSCVALIAIALALYWWQAKTVSVSTPQDPAAIEQGAASQVQANQVQANLSGVVVNAVSYSEQPEQRFAMVNGKMVREGDFVEAGLMVEEIQKDTVVLNLRGEQISRKP